MSGPMIRIRYQEPPDIPWTAQGDLVPGQPYTYATDGLPRHRRLAPRWGAPDSRRGADRQGDGRWLVRVRSERRDVGLGHVNPPASHAMNRFDHPEQWGVADWLFAIFIAGGAVIWTWLFIVFFGVTFGG